MFGGKLTHRRIVEILTAISVVLVAAAYVVAAVQAVRDRVCELGHWYFCQEQMEERWLESADWDRTELNKVARDAKTPSVQQEARSKVNTIDSGCDLMAVKNDKDGLKRLIESCKTPIVKQLAEEQLKHLEPYQPPEGFLGVFQSLKQKFF